MYNIHYRIRIFCRIQSFSGHLGQLEDTTIAANGHL